MNLGRAKRMMKTIRQILELQELKRLPYFQWCDVDLTDDDRHGEVEMYSVIKHPGSNTSDDVQVHVRILHRQENHFQDVGIYYAMDGVEKFLLNTDF